MKQRAVFQKLNKIDVGSQTQKKGEQDTKRLKQNHISGEITIAITEAQRIFRQYYEK